MEQKLFATCVALAVLGLVMAVPQGTALARGGMQICTADLCPTGNRDTSTDPAIDESNGLGTAAVVTDRRFDVTAWAMSLDSLKATQFYDVVNVGTGVSDCVGPTVYSIQTDSDGNAFQNQSSSVPVDVGDVIQISRDNIAILSGDLEKGGKERNKPNRYR